MADSRIRHLLEAIQPILDEPPHGMPAPVLEGLQNLSDGLRKAPEGDPSPGQREAAQAASETMPSDLEDDSQSNRSTLGVSPGHSAAMNAARGV